jgi:hypothetical protein
MGDAGKGTVDYGGRYWMICVGLECARFILLIIWTVTGN